MGKLIANSTVSKATKSRVNERSTSYGQVAPGLGIAAALFTQTQQRVIGQLFARPDESFSVSELIAHAGGGSGAVQRELARLVGSGLVEVRPLGLQRRYQANPQSPIHAELVSIIRKTVALADPLREALAPLAAHIHAAFVFGSIAKGSDSASSDIDLMIVSDSLTYADVMAALHPAIEQLRREVNPTLYSRAELIKRRKQRNAFVMRVGEQPKLWLIGDEHAFCA